MPRYRHIGRSVSNLHPRLKHCLCEYINNLRREVTFCEEWLVQVLSLLDYPARREFVRFIMARASRQASCRQPHALSPHGTERFAGHIFSDIADKSLRLTARELERFAGRLFEKARAALAVAGRPGPRDAVSQLREMFGLSEEETGIMCLLCCIAQAVPLRNFFEQCSLGEFFALAATATKIPARKVRAILRHSGRLSTSGITGGNDMSSSELHFPVNGQVLKFLAGMDDIPLRDRYVREDRGRRFPAESFHVPEESVRIITALLKSSRPCHILLHGRAGTGKTEFARAVAARAGRKAWFAQNGFPQADPDHPWRETRLDLRAAAHLVPAGAGVLIMDEADSILNTRYFVFGRRDAPDKSWINKFLDESQVQVIWITNDTGFMEESSLRRFSYSLRFRPFTCRERRSAWQNLVKKHPLRRFLPPPLVEEMAARYRVSAAGIASALCALRDIIPPEKAGPENVKATLAELLKRHEEATGSEAAGALNLLTDKYDLSALNVSADPAQILESLRRFAECRRARGAEAAGNVNLLFWGPPGTGKTELAKYLANELALGLCLKRASDLLSMWVGGTEHNIKDAFEEAERDQAILLIDEADSFFISRESALRSWETSQTNELLTRMENYRGILVCCTNLPDHLDRAVLRRFAWKVEFKPLSGEGRLKIYARYFPGPGRSLDPAEQRRLALIPGLTPGDVKAAWQKFRFCAPEALDHRAVIAALEEEAGYRRGRSGPIGFK